MVLDMFERSLVFVSGDVLIHEVAEKMKVYAVLVGDQEVNF